jgi:threonine aldolase
MQEICERAHEHHLPVHLDGARIFNAATYLGLSVAEITRGFDSVMFCLSKGLGAPVGSMLVGSRDFIAAARAARKALGGGMRQAGILAAAGLIALEHGPSRLHEDHATAGHLAEGLAQIPGIAIDLAAVETNIVICDVSETGKTSSEIASALKTRGVLAGTVNPRLMRFVTHLNVSSAQCNGALEVLREICKPVPA